MKRITLAVIAALIGLALFGAVAPLGTHAAAIQGSDGVVPTNAKAAEVDSIGAFVFNSWGPSETANTVTSGTPTLTVDQTSVATGDVASIVGLNFTFGTNAVLQYTYPDGTVSSSFVTVQSDGSFADTLPFSTAYGCGATEVQAYDPGTGLYSNTVAVNAAGC